MSHEQKTPLLGLSCREASRLASAALDRPLTRRERWALGIHTLLCSACRRFAQQMRLLRAAFGELPDDRRRSWAAGEVALSAERRAQIERLLADAGRQEAQD